MRQQRTFSLVVYIIADYLMAALAWALFFLFRKWIIEGHGTLREVFQVLDPKFYLGTFLIPLCWLVLYFLSGSYTDLFRKSRLAELNRSLIVSVIGVTIIFFTLILNDYVENYRDYYLSYLFLFGAHFSLLVISRMTLLNRAKSRLESGRFAYNTLMIGGHEEAVELYRELTGGKKSLGYHFVGFISANGNSNFELEADVPLLGGLKDLKKVIRQQEVDEVLIAVEKAEHPFLNQIISGLSNKNLVIKIKADTYDIISGSVKLSNVLSAALIEIYPEIIPRWQRIIKRGLDVLVSVVAMVLLCPLLLLSALRVRFSSPGSILFFQKRLGRNGKPFRIIKFRSMYVDSESDGPRLSSEDDPRITPWGRTMRKWRFDELPQLWNVIKGEMSLVGPRPERSYYAKRIIEKAPAYRHLRKVKPGLTSWGMVKFGYASSVDEMVERMKYDLLYIENMSLAIDFKIMIYTVLIILQGKGK